MLSIVNTVLQYMLLNLLQLAIGCLFPFVAGLMKKRGIHIAAEGRGKKLLVILASALVGLVLPVGPFGAVPVVAALLLIGLELPLVLPLIVSNILFNMAIPLTETVFVWNGYIILIAAAFTAGVLAGLLLSLRKVNKQDVLRKSTLQHFFNEQENQTNYFIILLRYIEAAGLFIVAGAVLKAGFSAELSYWLQNQFFASDAGLATMTMLARLNVFNPVFGASVLILGRLIDFTALASAAFLFKAKCVAALYAYYIAFALVLAVGLFF